MFGKKNHAQQRQDWKPHWALQILQKLWLASFSVIKIVAGAAATVLLICGVCAFVFVGIMGDYLESDILPEADYSLDDYTLDLTSFLYYVDQNGDIQTLQKVYSSNSREWADLEEIPKELIYATVAIEDKRFFEHQGVDWFTTIKACAGMFFGGSTVGGSSLTQQLIKNLTGENSITVQRKVMEIFRAVCVEKSSTKDTIIELYLNTIYMGNRISGVRSAAEYYFGKELESLTTAECASLISITNNPSIFDPYRKAFKDGGKSGAERNRERQEIVLKEMCNQGWISREEYEAALAQEMVFESGVSLEERINTCPNEACLYRDVGGNFRKDGDKYYCPKCGIEVNLAQVSSQGVYSWFTECAIRDFAKALAKRAGAAWNDATKALYMNQIQRGGFHIYTTMDPYVQTQVDEIYGNLNYIPETRSGQQLQSAIVVIDNRTGDVVGYAGGVGEKTVYDGLNRAETALQTGSAIKPLSIYAPAFEMGAINPATIVYDLPLQYNETGVWPNNDNRKFSYTRTIYNAVEDSINGAATNVLDSIGVSYSFEYAKYKFGLSTLVESNVLSDGRVQSDKDYAPLAMGAQTKGVTVRDIATAYATFANNGIYRESRTFTKVYDSNGKIVMDNEKKEERVLGPKTINYLNYCLVNAVKNGTGSTAYFEGTEIGGKTGTTSSKRDRWFCGYTGYYTAAVWCGFDQPEVITLKNGSYNPASYMWKKVMQPLHKNYENKPLYSLEEMVEIAVCKDSGKLAGEACINDVRTTDKFSRVETIYVYPEDVPVETCDKHIMMDVCQGGDGVANPYCYLFSAVENLTPESGYVPTTVLQRGLVKLTQKEINVINKTIFYQLWPEFWGNSYVYQVDESGEGVPFKGFQAIIPEIPIDPTAFTTAAPTTVPETTVLPELWENEEPCKYCTVHNRQAWEDYLLYGPALPDPSDPTEPTDPVADPEQGGAWWN